MKTILISPWARNTPSGQKCAKNYPYWRKLIELLKNKGFKIICITAKNEERLPCDEYYSGLSFEDIKKLLFKCDTWISVDNFFHHFASFYKKTGVVIFSKSDPNIFGDQSNINLLKHRRYLRKKQFYFWDNENLDKSSFIEPEDVLDSVIKLVNR